MNKQRNLALVLLPLVLAVGIAGGLLISHIDNKKAGASQTKLQTIMDLIGEEYVDELDVDSLLESMFPSLLSSLDPHSEYIPASEFDMANGMLEGSFGGIGISYMIYNDTVYVTKIIPGGPSVNSGLKVGDKIIKANGKKLTGPDVIPDSVINVLRGQTGEKVSLTINRKASSKPLEISVVRGDVPMNSISASYMIADGVGYIMVNTFSRDTYNGFMEALNKLKSQGAKKYIIDLRDNGGGFLDPAVLMANEFLPKGKKIVMTKGRKQENNFVEMSDGSGKFQDVEIVVVTNENSASASEIFAGAIQDNDRGLVIGRRTFGKGLVQNQIKLPDNSAVRLTVARYYTPSGRCIQKPFERGSQNQYISEIVDRYNHGEFYNADSIKIDKSKVFNTTTGRKVYGGGGIMPDVFVAQDTIGYTKYLMQASESELMHFYALNYVDKYRNTFKNVTNIKQLKRVLPDDNILLDNFVNFAVDAGLPARWYYINQSKDIILRQIKAYIANIVLDNSEMYEILNEGDVTINRALKELQEGNSPILIKNKK